MKYRFSFFIILLFFCNISARAQQLVNIPSTQTETIRAISQDSTGMMWFATGDALFKYDGFDLRNVDVSAYSNIKSANCSYVDKSSNLVLGCENGMLVVNTLTMEARSDRRMNGLNVRCLVYDGKNEWAGTDHGLYLNRKPVAGIKSDLEILSILDSGRFVYAGCYSGLWKYSKTGHTWEMVKGSESLLVSGLSHMDNGNICIGTGTSLSEFNPSNGKIEMMVEMPVVKCMANYDDMIFAGSENGLYLVGSDNVEILNHDARNSASIAGDAIWSIFMDRDKNIWIGTENGISLIPSTHILNIIPISTFTHDGYGNQIHVILHDSKDRWWFGGTHGVICLKSWGTSAETFSWYKMNDSRFPIIHNRIRCMMEDSLHTIWMGGDGGLMMLNESTLQFERKSILSDKNNWIYGIEQKNGNTLVVTTFESEYDVDIKSDNESEIKPLSKRSISHSVNASLSAEVGNHKWLLNGDVIEISNGADSTVYKMKLPEKFLCIYYDAASKKVVLGGVDKLAVVEPSKLNMQPTPRRMTVTSVMINGTEEQDLNVFNDDVMYLRNDQNNVSIYFSDFDFKKEKTETYAFRVNNQKEWVQLKTGQNCIILSDLSPGNYSLYVADVDYLDSAEAKTPLFTFRIAQPWYLTTWAWMVYIALFAVILYVIILNIVQKKRIRIEKRKREIMVARAKQKVNLLEKDKVSLQHQLKLQMASEAKNSNELSQDDKFLLKITKIVEDNIDQTDLSVQKLSELSGISTKQLSRKLKKMTDMSTVEFIRNMRLRKASLLLHNDRFTIAEVMYMVGFTNASYFTRSFVALYKMTPSEYKDSQRMVAEE